MAEFCEKMCLTGVNYATGIRGFQRVMSNHARSGLRPDFGRCEHPPRRLKAAIKPARVHASSRFSHGQSLAKEKCHGLLTL